VAGSGPGDDSPHPQLGMRGVGQITPISYSPQHSVRSRLPEGELDNGLDMPCRIG
jgi:hypothetical protein